ncbi:DUF1329 domain-containing protein [Crenobacter sp. SG2305]|uniref:DUF1329 domain-containing protein n=1 Tax=Crenobacter oryzisoli TaxID=3056844 RepID=UPI0025AAC07F|nr:DUF1329 domain-containing protein [Crenobacter sp. SG2305]MDN0083498.1 DUF1329 domain-containing protein [Crenobacter sp. SG2305]
MAMHRIPTLALVGVCLAAASASGWAKVSQAEADKLGKELTCIGAEKAGNKDGTIPAYSGKWLGVPPGLGYKGTGTPLPDPYASEKPLFVITAQNMGQYGERLTPGMKALLKKYPDSYNIPVYPSHRDFRYAEWVCKTAKENAQVGELQDEGMGVDALTGAPAFPIPKSGLELLWNSLLPVRAWKEQAVYDQAVVYPKGNIAWGRVKYDILAPVNDPTEKQRPHTTNVLSSYFLTSVLLPERQAGEIYVGKESNNFKTTPRDTWSYNPGTRRVRQAPQFGFDMPFGPGGFRTVDDDRLFNGSPERYNWRIVGKREYYIPYDAYRFDDPSRKYADILKPGHADPDAMRYELHRVWVLEATLKQGYRHQYAKRVMYLDEDTYHMVMADNYDARGQLWRVAQQNYVYAYDMKAFQARTALFYDLVSGAYLADRLSNQQNAPSLNAANFTADHFTPDAARRAGR